MVSQTPFSLKSNLLLFSSSKHINLPKEENKSADSWVLGLLSTFNVQFVPRGSLPAIFMKMQILEEGNLENEENVFIFFTFLMDTRLVKYMYATLLKGEWKKKHKKFKFLFL